MATRRRPRPPRRVSGWEWGNLPEAPDPRPVVGHHHDDDDPAAPVTCDEVHRFLRACHRKVNMSARAARSSAAEMTRRGEGVAAYQCPWSSWTDIAAHWHVGKPPTVLLMRRMATVLRWLHDHPECVER